MFSPSNSQWLAAGLAGWIKKAPMMSSRAERVICFVVKNRRSGFLAALGMTGGNTPITCSADRRFCGLRLFSPDSPQTAELKGGGPRYPFNRQSAIDNRQSFMAQRHHGLNLRCPPRRDVASGERHCDQQDRDTAVGQRVGCGDPEELAAQEGRENQGYQESEG